MNADILPPPESIIQAYIAARGSGALDADQLDVRVVSRGRKFSKRLFDLEIVNRDDGVSAQPATLFAKSYRDPARGETAFARLRYLRAHGLSDEPYTLVRPIAWFADTSLLLMEKAAGTPLHHRMLAAPDDVAPARAAANWLLRLHATPQPTPPLLRRQSPRPVVNLARICDELSLALPTHRERIASLRSRVAAGDAISAGATGAATLHGDFHPRNVFVDGERVAVIDLDHAILGDPAWDLGYLIGQLESAAHERWSDFTRLARATSAAVDAYVRDAAPAEARALRRRLPRYRALTLLESLHYGVCILHLEDHARATRLLEACERILNADDLAA